MSLGWVPDVEYADLWIALERHYIADAGLRFSYLPGGPNAPQPVLEISAGEADFGDSDWLLQRSPAWAPCGRRGSLAWWPGNGQRLCAEAYWRPNFPGQPRGS
jgi:hypothetical protein